MDTHANQGTTLVSSRERDRLARSSLRELNPKQRTGPPNQGHYKDQNKMLADGDSNNNADGYSDKKTNNVTSGPP